MPPLRPLNNYLRMHRKRSGLTQAELAFVLGCAHRSKVSRYERGARIPSLTTVIGLEVVFGKRTSILFPGTYASVRREVRVRAEHLAKDLSGKPRTAATKDKLNWLFDLVHPSKPRSTT